MNQSDMDHPDTSQQNQAIARKWFSGRMLSVASKHSKETALAGILESRLGVVCKVAEGLDTDSLGTFTGEIPRKEDPLTTARMKCKLAMDMAGNDLAVASEGSFGPHPDYFFLPADDELLVFVDRRNGIEVVARELSTVTNFKSSEISSLEELRQFASACGFPSHGIILRSSHHDIASIRKGIVDWQVLEADYSYVKGTFGSVYAETDMRAHLNPTRMEVIRKAAQRLADKLVSCCPSCGLPGFSITGVVRGLPCSDCEAPTRSILAELHQCQRCRHLVQKRYPSGKSEEDPMFCDRCNP